MKLGIKSALSVIAAMALLASCSNDREEEILNKLRTPISYNMGDSRVTGSHFDNNDQIAVWANFVDNDDTSLYINSQQVRFTDGVWTPDVNYFWPAQGKLDFYSTYPSPAENAVSANKLEVTPGNVPIVEYHINNISETKDVMAAKTLQLDCTQPKSVPLQFNHVLSKVNLNIQNLCTFGGIGLDIIVDTVIIRSSVYHDCRLNWETMAMEPYGEKEQYGTKIQDIYMPSNESNTVKNFFVIPETLENLAVDIYWRALINGVATTPFNVKKLFTEDITLKAGEVTNINFKLEISTGGNITVD